MSHNPLAMRILLPQPFGYLREFVLAEYQLKDTFGAITQPHRANSIERPLKCFQHLSLVFGVGIAGEVFVRFNRPVGDGEMVRVDMLFSSSSSTLKAKVVRLLNLKTWVFDLKEFFDETILFENHHPPYRSIIVRPELIEIDTACHRFATFVTPVPIRRSRPIRVITRRLMPQI